jgi:WD40 repeat protein
MDEFPLHPCAWSSKDALAAVIRGRVFTHDMDTNAVSSLEEYGLAACVEWTSDNELAVGYDWGGVVLFDGGSRTMRKYLLPRFSPFEVSSVGPNAAKVKAMSWSKEHGVLAVGRMSGEVSYFDPRQDKPIRSDRGDAMHPVLGVKWSPDGVFLASGHKGGIVKCMDWKANRTFELKQPHGKTAHKAAIKVR